MTPEANPTYKVLRSLWFPMSVNAALLGTLAVVIFRAVSLVAAWAFGFPGDPWEADSSFGPTLVDLAVGGLSSFGRIGALGDYLGVFLVQATTAYVLWATFGVAMCRTLAVRIARDEYSSLGSAWRFAMSTKTTTLLYLPLIALPIAFCWVVVAVAGLVGAVPYVGWTLNAVFLPLTAFFAIVMQMIWFVGLVVLGFTPAAVATERRGTSDALGKGFHYCFARPLPTILYLLVLFAFFWIAEKTIFAPDRLRESLASILGAFVPSETFGRIVRGDVHGTEGYARFAAWLHLLVLGGVDAIARGAFLSWAAGGFTALFLMFRQDCDGNDVSDVVAD